MKYHSKNNKKFSTRISRWTYSIGHSKIVECLRDFYGGSLPRRLFYTMLCTLDFRFRVNVCVVILTVYVIVFTYVGTCYFCYLTF